MVLGSVEVFAGAFSGQGVGPADIGRFLLWATLGNAVGGVVFVAILKYGVARPEARPTRRRFRAVDRLRLAKREKTLSAREAESHCTRERGCSAEMIRGHWSIENRSQSVRDVTLGRMPAESARAPGPK